MSSRLQITEDHRDEYRWLGAFACLAALTMFAATMVGAGLKLPASIVVDNYMATILRLFPHVILMGLIGYGLMAVAQRRATPAADLAGMLRDRFRTPASSAATLAPILLAPVVMGSFGAMKMLIPYFRNFDWDDRLARLDQTLFLGWHPWQITHFLFGSEAATRFLDVVYTLWVPIMFLAVLIAAFSSGHVRARFFLAYALGWAVLGTAGAYAFASAGPCYQALIGAASASEYGPLMERLHAMSDNGYSLGAVQWQQVLWDAHSNRRFGFAMGISAMPSMHNAMTTLYVLALWNVSRTYRNAACLFWIVIFIGSIHLGWHYAVDGLASALVMVALWKLAGIYLRWSGYEDAICGARKEQPATSIRIAASPPVSVNS